MNEEFLNGAFSQREQKIIETSYLTTENNPTYGTSGGEETADKVYILSQAEADALIASKILLDYAVPTKYAAAQGSIDVWWQRTPGANAQHVTTNYYWQVRVNTQGIGVRPAVKIRTDKDIYDGADSSDVAGAGDEAEGGFDSSVFLNLKVGRIIEFGHYEQDNNLDNDAEPIRWKVFEMRDGTALLLSESVLDARAFDDKDQDSSWENSSLRAWLNQEFYQAAFTDAEQKWITKGTIPNPSIPEFGTKSGNETEDSVFLLSLNELESYLSGMSDRQAKATVYAIGMNVLKENKDEARWWLRTPGGSPNASVIVYPSGTINKNGLPVNNEGGGVRPAIRIRLP